MTGTMTFRPYVILGKNEGWPGEQPRCAVFVDTTGDDLLRDGVDFDLSHWYPNRTPTHLRADTSTEIALRYAAGGLEDGVVGVGDHADTDGILSLFALVAPDLALDNRDLLVTMAEMGDFSFYGEGTAAAVYHALRTFGDAGRSTLSVADQFRTCFDHLVTLLSEGAPAEAAQRAGALERSADLVANGRVARTEFGERVVGYRVDSNLAPVHIAHMWREPRFDQPLDGDVWLSHRGRNRIDRERIQILSVPDDGGWQHAVWFPHYIPWDIETLWRPPGFTFTGDRLVWSYRNEKVEAAVAALAVMEHAGVRWNVVGEMAPWTPGSPVLIRPETPAGHPAPSGVDPETLLGLLGPALEVAA